MELVLINKHGTVLDLVNNRNKFILMSAEGLHGVETDFTETENPYMDGTTVENVRALPRGIELVFKLVGDVQSSIEFFTSVVKSKQRVTLRERKGGKYITVKGIATIPPYTRMVQSCKITLSIYCGQPYWEDIQYLVEVIKGAIDMLYFPVAGQYFTPVGRVFGIVNKNTQAAFTNESDTSVGMICSIVASGEVVNPRISCSSGEQNGWWMQINITLNAGDEVRICTEKGNKYITVNGSDTYNGSDVLNYLQFYGKDWLQLETGENTFNVTAKSGESNVYFSLIYKGRYE